MPEVTAPKIKRRVNADFINPVRPDEPLAAIIGSQPVSRSEVTRKLWAYIWANDLQDHANKTRIKADWKLKAVFDGREQVTMFEMTKLVFKHVR